MSDQSWLHRLWRARGRSERAAEMTTESAQGSPCCSAASAEAASSVSREDSEEEIWEETLPLNSQLCEYDDDNDGFQPPVDRRDGGHRPLDEFEEEDERSTPLAAAQRLPRTLSSDLTDRILWLASRESVGGVETTARFVELPCLSGISAEASFVSRDLCDSEENIWTEIQTLPMNSQVYNCFSNKSEDDGVACDFRPVVGRGDSGGSGCRPQDDMREGDERRNASEVAARRPHRSPSADLSDRNGPAWIDFDSTGNIGSSYASSRGRGSSSGDNKNAEFWEERRKQEDAPKRPTPPPRRAALPARVIENPAYDLSSDDEHSRLRAHFDVPTGQMGEDDDSVGDRKQLRRSDAASRAREERLLSHNDDDDDGGRGWRQAGIYYSHGGENVVRDLPPLANEVSVFARRGPLETRTDHDGERNIGLVINGSDNVERKESRRGRRDPEAVLEERELRRGIRYPEAVFQERELRRGIRYPEASLEEEELGHSRRYPEENGEERGLSRDMQGDLEEGSCCVADPEDSGFRPDDGRDTQQRRARGADRREDGGLLCHRDGGRDIVVYDVQVEDEDDGSDTVQRDFSVEFEDRDSHGDERDPEHRYSNHVGSGLEEGEFQRHRDALEPDVDDDLAEDVLLVEDVESRPGHRAAEAACPGRPGGEERDAEQQRNEVIEADQPRNEVIEADDDVEVIEVVENQEAAEVAVVAVQVWPAAAGPASHREQRQSGRSSQTMEGGERNTSLSVESSATAAAAQQAEVRTLKDENNFIQNVSQFFNQEDISDVVLKVGSQTFFGHKFVLAKSSEVFRTMLYDKRWQQSQLPEIDLEESEECQRHFEPFLRFLYTAEVQICTESAVGILCLADKYSVMSLKSLCTRYMVENTLSPKVRNALNWYSWAKALHMEDLIDSCTKTISWNMEQLFALPEWLQMDIDFVADIVSNPQLVVSNEFLLFEAVERWLLHDQHMAELSDNSKKLLPLVRFPQMMVQQLYKVETGELASKEGSKELIEKLLNKAYRFRSLCPFQADLEITFSDEFYRPRNYKDLTVDTVRMQNTLRFGIQVDVRTYVGPVPSSVREGEWKITYRKANDTWTLQVYCHDSAMVNGEARIQAVLVISDDDDRVLQVEASDETVCSRGSHLSMVITLPSTNEAKLMTVLIKPLPN